MARDLTHLPPDDARLVAAFRREIAHRYSPLAVRLGHWIVDLFVKPCFFSDVLVNGLEHYLSVPPGTPTIISSLHKSHLDYILLGLVLRSHGVNRLPATIAGKNLFHGLFRHLLPLLKGVCLDRVRANPANLRSHENLLYLSTFYDYIMKEVIERGDAVVIFPEAGRSYDGRVLPLTLGVFGIAKRALQLPEHRVAIVPVSISYDRVTEDARFNGLRQQKQISRRAYRAHDKGAFYEHAFWQPRGAAYVDFGPPMFLTDVRRMDELESELRTRMGSLVRVTSTALVCRALVNRDSSPWDHVLSHIARDRGIIRARSLLTGNGVQNGDPAQVVAHALPHLANPRRRRDILRIEGPPHARLFRVVRPDVVSYYANTVAHLFPPDA
ncbi:MAG: 1-acyl-sn-glycerol-3-phosphate acyltransferase [bacterium]|nr:1-acyl-sn-glycerol-3-phosphate acyltransferase [bacterium]